MFKPFLIRMLLFILRMGIGLVKDFRIDAASQLIVPRISAALEHNVLSIGQPFIRQHHPQAIDQVFQGIAWIIIILIFPKHLDQLLLRNVAAAVCHQKLQQIPDFPAASGIF